MLDVLVIWGCTSDAFYVVFLINWYIERYIEGLTATGNLQRSSKESLVQSWDEEVLHTHVLCMKANLDTFAGVHLASFPGSRVGTHQSLGMRFRKEEAKS